MSAVGRRIDRYVIEAELDSGGFGTVYRARHTVIGRTIALKLLHPSRGANLDVIERFLREARIVASLSSPHIVQVLDAGMTEDRQLFLAMELLEGESLAARIHRVGALSVRDALGLARQILLGLAAAHAAGVVHRDLKPANVFVTRTADHREIAKVLDFGISKSRARIDDSVITMTGAVLGTPHYMAPEQLHGARDVDSRADLYAFAVVLYEMLSARLPYQAATLESLIAKRLTEPPIALASIAAHLPRELTALVDRGLARDPDARFRTAQEIDRALAAIEAAPLPMTTPPQRLVVSASAHPPGPSLAMAPTYATPSARHDVASSNGATRASPPRAPGTTTFPARLLGVGALVVLLGLAAVVILVLSGALAGLVTALVMTRSPEPAVAPITTRGDGVGAPSTRGDGPVVAVAPPPEPPAIAVPVEPPAAPIERPQGALRVWVDGVLGRVDSGALRTLLDRATPAIDRCRRDVDDDVRLQVFANPDGSIPISQPDVNRAHGDDATARCVANAIRDAAPIPAPAGDGIVTVLAHLPARR